MFAYCNNDPISFADLSGNMRTSCVMMSDSMCRSYPPEYVAYIKRQKKLKEIKRAIVNYVTNDDEQAVLDAESIAFYKGVPVVKSSIVEGTAFSCGVIIMGSDVASEELVRHEYGHTQQLKELGILTYISTVVVPSVTGFMVDVIADMSESMYYSLPWERQADIMGNANHDHSGWADGVSQAYWTWSKFVSSIIP